MTNNGLIEHSNLFRNFHSAVFTCCGAQIVIENDQNGYRHNQKYAEE